MGDLMKLFSNSKQPAATLVSELDEQLPEVNHNTVLDYMLELSDEDYDKLLKVAAVYRKANKQAAEIMGVEGVAATAEETPAADDPEAEIDDFLNDELETAFLEDEPKQPKSKKVSVKED